MERRYLGIPEQGHQFNFGAFQSGDSPFDAARESNPPPFWHGRVVDALPTAESRHGMMLKGNEGGVMSTDSEKEELLSIMEGVEAGSSDSDRAMLPHFSQLLAQVDGEKEKNGNQCYPHSQQSDDAGISYGPLSVEKQPPRISTKEVVSETAVQGEPSTQTLKEFISYEKTLLSLIQNEMGVLHRRLESFDYAQRSLNEIRLLKDDESSGACQEMSRQFFEMMVEFFKKRSMLDVAYLSSALCISLEVIVPACERIKIIDAFMRKLEGDSVVDDCPQSKPPAIVISPPVTNYRLEGRDWLSINFMAVKLCIRELQVALDNFLKLYSDIERGVGDLQHLEQERGKGVGRDGLDLALRIRSKQLGLSIRYLSSGLELTCPLTAFVNKTLDQMLSVCSSEREGV